MSFSDFSICSPKISRLAEKSFPLTMCFQNCPWCWHVLSLKGCGAWTVRPKWSTIHTNSPQPGCSYWVYQLISAWWFQNSVSQNVSQKKSGLWPPIFIHFLKIGTVIRPPTMFDTFWPNALIHFTHIDPCLYGLTYWNPLKSQFPTIIFVNPLWSMFIHFKPKKTISHHWITTISHRSPWGSWGATGHTSFHRPKVVIPLQSSRLFRRSSGIAMEISRWFLIGGLENEFYFSTQLGMSSSQLSNSIIFQRGRYTTNQI